MSQIEENRKLTEQDKSYSKILDKTFWAEELGEAEVADFKEGDNIKRETKTKGST